MERAVVFYEVVDEIVRNGLMKFVPSELSG